MIRLKAKYNSKWFRYMGRFLIISINYYMLAGFPPRLLLDKFKCK